MDVTRNIERVAKKIFLKQKKHNEQKKRKNKRNNKYLSLNNVFINTIFKNGNNNSPFHRLVAFLKILKKCFLLFPLHYDNF